MCENIVHVNFKIVHNIKKSDKKGKQEEELIRDRLKESVNKYSCI
jgi:hypothetical protein